MSYVRSVSGNYCISDLGPMQRRFDGTNFVSIKIKQGHWGAEHV